MPRIPLRRWMLVILAGLILVVCVPPLRLKGKLNRAIEGLQNKGEPVRYSDLAELYPIISIPFLSIHKREFPSK